MNCSLERSLECKFPGLIGRDQEKQLLRARFSLLSQAVLQVYRRRSFSRSSETTKNQVLYQNLENNLLIESSY